jgi:sugar lactone lactonase YvrE
VLISQAGILLDPTNTLYVGDNGNRVLAFTLENLTGQVLTNFSNWPAFMCFDNRTSNIYITIVLSHIIYIWPSNQTIPPDGVAGTNCSLSTLRGPTGIAIDSLGNVYVSSFYCNWITKWAPNATTSTLFAGSPTGASGWDAITLYAPYGLALDESNSFLYVADRYNYRIQRFPMDGSGIGVTVAGDNGEGPASNQIFRPTAVYISKLDGSLYISDCYNNRIQKWTVNATVGITVAGDPNGASGNTPYLLNRPYAFAFDPEEKYMYVSDSVNNRIQRFTLY